MEKIIIIALIGILTFLSLGLTIYGIVLGFMAHVLMGVAAFLVTPFAWLVGFTQFFFGYNIAEAIVALF